jgi:hypothetical protein
MHRSAILRFALLVWALAASACAGEPTASQDPVVTIDREVFIATYVDLRTAVLRSEEHELADRDRARILSDHDVTEDDLLEFAAVHGTDVAFMRAVWDEVEGRLDAVRMVPGTDDRR